MYVADPGYMLARGDVPRSAIITQLAGERTPDVAAFMRQLACLKHGQRVPLQYYLFDERHRQKTAILHIDHRWWAHRHCTPADDQAHACLTCLVLVPATSHYTRYLYPAPAPCQESQVGSTARRSISPGDDPESCIQSVKYWLCRYGKAHHWTRDDAPGTWSCDDSVTLIEAAEMTAKQQASHDVAMEKIPAEAEIDDEVCLDCSVLRGIELDQDIGSTAAL